MKLNLRPFTSTMFAKTAVICCLLGSVLCFAGWVRHNRHEQCNTDLIKAVHDGSEPRVEASLNGGANVNVYFDPGTLKALPEPSFWSIANINLKNLTNFNTKRAKAKQLPPSERAPVLSLAITYLRQDAVERLLTLGADVDAPDSKGSTPLHYAAEHNALSIVIDLLDHHADVNRKNRVGNTPLHIAVYNHNLPDANVLLDKGADVNVVNGDGYTPVEILSFQCESLHHDWLVQSMTNLAETKQTPQNLIDRHYQHQLELLRPLLAVLEKKGAKLSEATQRRLIDSFHLDEHEIEEALK